MNFQDAVKKVILENYCNFNGRAGKAEFWYFFLFYVVCSSILSTLARNIPVLSILSLFFSLGLFLPYLGVMVRRLHDVGKATVCVLLAFVPCVGLVVLYWCAQDSQQGDNEFGPAPMQ